MNWLAHVYLSEPDVEVRLGNLLADLVKGKDRLGMSELFLRGVRCHQLIDSFTDFHPAVFQSRARIQPLFRRYAGILMDVFYDHFLARNWHLYSDVPLVDFTADLYSEILSHPLMLPAEASEALSAMIQCDRLAGYRELAGIEDALERVSLRLSARLRRPIELAPAVRELEANYAEIEKDFLEFFPALRARVEEWRAMPQGVGRTVPSIPSSLNLTRV